MNLIPLPCYGVGATKVPRRNYEERRTPKARLFFLLHLRMSTTTGALRWRDLRNPNKVWTAKSYKVELPVTEAGEIFHLSEVYDVPDPLRALSSAILDCQHSHPFARIDIDRIRIYER